MRSIGLDNFKKEILQFASSREELNKLEAEYVNLDTINDPKCYNMITGGWQDNNPHILSDEALERRSASIRKRYAEDEDLVARTRTNTKEFWERPGYAEKALAGLKKWTSDPELNAERGKRISATINDAEHKDKHLAQCNAAIANGREVLKQKTVDINYRRRDSKYLLCITTGEIFPNFKSAYAAHGSRHIRDVCYGARKHTRDKITKQQLEWKFISEEEYLERNSKCISQD